MGSRLLPGLAAATAVAIAARWSTGVLPPYVSEVSVGVVAGLVVANVISVPRPLLPGVKFAASTVLRLGIVLLGAKLSVGAVLSTGVEALVLILIGVVVVVLLTIVMARLVRIPIRLAMLIGVGTAICGNSAIAATAPVIRADENETSFAVATITLFGTLAVVLYPLIGLAIGMSDDIYGRWVGLAVNDTSQVTAAAFAYSDAAGETATVVKLTRNALIGPAIIAIGFLYPFLERGTRIDKPRSRPPLLTSVPPFVLGFMVLALANSLGLIPAPLSDLMYDVAKFLILIALVGLGMQTSLARLKGVGFSPLWAGFVIAAGLSATALLLSIVIIDRF